MKFTTNRPLSPFGFRHCCMHFQPEFPQSRIFVVLQPRMCLPLSRKILRHSKSECRRHKLALFSTQSKINENFHFIGTHIRILNMRYIRSLWRQIDCRGASPFHRSDCLLAIWYFYRICGRFVHLDLCVFDCLSCVWFCRRVCAF